MKCHHQYATALHALTINKMQYAALLHSCALITYTFINKDMRNARSHRDCALTVTE